jgi:hypothetical protein
MKFNGGIGTAPMPGGQKKEKNSGRERKGSPQEKIEARESQVGDKKGDQKKEAGRTIQDPAGNPRIAGSMGNPQKDGRG